MAGGNFTTRQCRVGAESNLGCSSGRTDVRAKIDETPLYAVSNNASGFVAVDV
jgi:hypothetical protein